MTSSRYRSFKKRAAWTFRLGAVSVPVLGARYLGAPLSVPVTFALLGSFLLLIPRSCRATNSTNAALCSHNANGLLGGCHIRSHKWQNASRAAPLQWRPQTARPDFLVTRVRLPSSYGATPLKAPDQGLWSSASAKVTTLGAMGSATGVLVALGAWWLPR
jgi:hypothetical protein